MLSNDVNWFRSTARSTRLRLEESRLLGSDVMRLSLRFTMLMFFMFYILCQGFRR